MAQQQLTPEQKRAIQSAQNQRFMALSYESPILANNENGNEWKQGRSISYSSPIVSGAYASKITLRHKLVAHVTKGSGAVNPTAAYPYSLVNNVQVSFGSKQISVHPYISKVNSLIEGYARTLSDSVAGYESKTISDMLHKVPTTLEEGDNVIKFDTDIELNALHPSSVNGLIPIFSSGTRLQVNLTLPSAVASDKADALDQAFETTSDATVTVTGTVDVIITYRDFNSMTDSTNAVTPDLNNLPTVQVVQLPSISGMGSKTWNYAGIKNPYPFAKIFHILLDGKQSNKFSSADNVIGYTLDKAENSNSNFVKYADEVGMEEYYKSIRSRFGLDLPEGIIVFDATTQNLSNVSSKMGSAYLNVGANGYPATRFGFKFNELADPATTGRAPRVISYGIILNEEGIKSL